MAKISKQEVEHIASLSRINLSEKEKEKYQAELSAILDFVSELNKVKTDNIEPLSSIAKLENIVREDKITNKPNTKKLLENTPDKEGDSIRTNKVLGGGPSA